MVCYVIICSILNHILDFSYSGERIYFGFIEERYEKKLRKTYACVLFYIVMIHYYDDLRIGY